MCSFLFFKTPNLHKYVSNQSLLTKVNRFMKFRGPDTSNMMTFDNCIFLHNLLHLHGNMTVQPITMDQCILLFNGEIYNWKSLYPNASCDTECIIPMYKKYGFEFAKYLDGEFAILIYDCMKNLVITTTDAFMTKPLFIAININTSEIGIASYKTALEELQTGNVEMMEPNTTLVIDAKSVCILKRLQVVTWDLTTKYRSDEDAMLGWEKAFENAVKKRALHGGKFFLPLSSGYDSGCISLALERQCISYTTFSTEGNENMYTLKDRIKRGRIFGCITSSFLTKNNNVDIDSFSHVIQQRCEPWTYVHDDGIGRPLDMHEDGGAKALCFICSVMQPLEYRVILSGSGADEIYSDYGFQGHKYYHHSEFGGLWPADISSIFPWKKFYHDTQRSYLFKDEFIAGGFSMEGRYPFLDTFLIQEWLWMPQYLKNKGYKFPLFYYMRKYNYPCEEGQKRGFSI